jgi:hypothetical protein
MKKSIQSFVAGLRQRFLMWRLEREIYGQVFPQINGLHDHQYPFRTDRELVDARIHATLDARLYLGVIGAQADAMGKAYGEAFRYLMFRDINARLRRYVQLVQSRVPEEERIPKYAH